MSIRKTIICILIFLGNGLMSRGQGSCPPNIDFELGDLSYWHFFRGSVNLGPAFSLTACPPVFGLHTLTAGTGTDLYGGFPIVDPGGGFYALRLGKDTNSGPHLRADQNADLALYYVDVPFRDGQTERHQGNVTLMQ